MSELAAPKELRAPRLPFSGTWFVAQGGDTLNVNHHMQVRAQWFGIDFAKVGGPGARALASVEQPTRNDECYSWDQPVLCPGSGIVVALERGLPDNPLGTLDVQHPAGNHIGIELAPGRYLFVAHLRHHSLAVAIGERVQRGQPIGRCGNSGHSDMPHVHLHVQDSPVLGDGTGQNLEFAEMDVQLSGKWFSNVTWPLIRGLFVRHHGG